MDRGEWKEIARRRIRRILGSRRVASKRQLETKISEAGPPHMRPDPHHISDALEELIEAGEVVRVGPVSAGIGRSTVIFAPSDWNATSPRDGARIQRIRVAYEEFLTITLKEDNGVSLQTIVQGAIQQSNQFNWLTNAGRPPQAGAEISGVAITGEGALDHYLIHKQTGEIYR